jgi:N-acetylneuraminic acid mutarotase
MNRLFTVILLCIVSSSYAQIGGTWTKKADLSTLNRESAVGFAINTKGYIGLGNVGGSPNGAMWEYDYSTNVWTQKANMTGGGRLNAIAFVISGMAYVGTGENISFALDKKIYQFNPSTNVWTAKTDFGGTARTEAVAFTIGTKGYVGTGYDGARKKDFWEYDATANTWTQKADFGGTARNRAVGFAIGSKGYIGTGNDGALKKDMWEYDPATNAWTRKSDFAGAARESAVAFVISSKGYIATGDAGTGKNDIWEYNPGTDDWVQRNVFPGQRRYAAAGFAISTNGKGYIGTGFTDEPATGVSTKDFYEFLPPVPPTAPTDAMVTAYTETSIRLNWLDRSYDETGFSIERSTNGTTFTTLTTLPAGAVTYTDNGLTTGQTYYYRVRSTKTADGPSAASNIASQTTGTPHNGTWNTVTDNIPESPKFDYGASSFTIDGIIYLTGATTSGGTPLVSARTLWAYDPTTGALTQKAVFAGEARTQGVGFALDGKGYVGTGTKLVNAMSSFKDFWQYDPATNQWTQKADLSAVGRFNALAFTIGNKAYVGTGITSTSGTTAKDFYEYDPIADTWTPKADFPQTASGLRAIGYQGRGYTIYPYTSPMPLYQYDPVANTWTTNSNFPIASYGMRALVVIKDRLFASTYTNDPPYNSTLWEFEVANARWIERAVHANGSQYYAMNVGCTDALIYYFSNNTIYEYNPDFDLKIPGALVAEIIDPLKVKITWTVDAATAGVQLYRADSEAGPYTLAAEVPRTKTVYVDNIEVAGKTLYYKVRAVNGALFSAYTNTVSPTKRGAWRQLKSMGSGVEWGDVAAATSTRGYVGVSTYTQSWWEFNPDNETWTQKAAFPGQMRSGLTSFSIDEKIYAGMGSAYDFDALKYKAFNDLYAYDPASNTWTKKADFPGTSRQYSSCTYGNGRGYVLGGDDIAGGATSFLNDVWEYNPTSDTWTQLTDMPVGTAFVSAFVRDGKLHFMNGSVKSGASSWGSVNQYYQLDLAAGTWSKGGNTMYYGSSGTVHQIGENAYFNASGMYSYNFTTAKWSVKPAMPGTTSGIRTFRINNKIYGVNNNYEVWVYNPEATVAEPENLDSEFQGDRIVLKWQNASTLQVKTEIQITNRYNQYEFVALGTTGVGATQYTITNLDPDNNYRFRAIAVDENGERSVPSNITFENTGPNWTELSTATFASRSNAVAFIADSKMYYGTGTYGTTMYKDLWEYDINTGAWTQKADFPGEERSDATAFKLGDYFYVGFGASKTSSSLKDLYRYSATTNSWTASVNYPNNNAICAPGVFVDNGYAYLLGGNRNSTSTITELWRFDGATWTQLKSMPAEPRRDPLIFVSNGKAYAGAGTKYVSGTTSLAGKDFWEYTIATDSWTQLGDMPDYAATLNRSYAHPGTSSVLAFVTANGGTAGVGIQPCLYNIAQDKWTKPGNPLTYDFLAGAFTSVQDPATGFAYVLVNHGTFGMRLWRYDNLIDGPNLVETKLISSGTAQLKWRKMTPRPDSVVIFRSNAINVLGTRQSVIKTADTTALNSVSLGQTYYYSIRAYSNSGQYMTSAQRMLTVDNAPAAPIELVGELVDDNIVLSWQPGVGPAATSYMVERSLGNSNNFSNIGTTPITTFTSGDIVAATMSYRVKAINTSGASGYSNVVTIMVTAVEEEKTVGVYPNPTTDYITIEVESQDGPVNMQLLDYNGHKLYSQSLSATSRVDLSSYPAGIYFVNLASTKRASNKYIKIIKK